MTAPAFPQLPNVQLGNTASDISSAVSSFAKGLQEERTKRRQEAMSEALMNLKMQEFLHPHPIHDIEMGQNGPENVWTNQNTMQEVGRSHAPNPMFYPPTNTGPGMTPSISGVGRYPPPGTQATNVPLPQGTVGRDIPPTPTPVEGPTGPSVSLIHPRTGAATPVAGAGGGAITPRAQQFEVEKGQFASNMARAAHGMSQASPQDVENVVSRLNSQAVLGALPVIGAPASEIVRSGMAVGLTPEQAKCLANFYTFVGFAVPEMAGKQMTATEMRQQTAMFAPLWNEPEEAREVKRGNVRFRVQSSIRASGSGWSRLINDPNIASQIPVEYGGTMQDVVAPPVGPTNRFTGRPRH